MNKQQRTALREPCAQEIETAYPRYGIDDPPFHVVVTFNIGEE